MDDIGGTFTKSPRKRRRLGALIVIVALVAAITGFASPASGTIDAAPFDATDGIIDANAGDPILDKPSGNDDDSYTQGAKEDDLCPVVETGSIPNNKADLTKFYVATGKGTTDTFLYLAWERASTNGTVTLDFELNKSGEVKPPPDCNGVNPTRINGDKLVTYDLTGNLGAETVVISVRTWGSGGWGLPATLNGNVAEGQIASDLLSGEAVINLEESGIFTRGACDNFATVLLKSRASSSFSSEMKDFVGPAYRHVSNCGPLTVSKTVVGGKAGDSFSFSVDCPGRTKDGSFSLKNGESKTIIDIPNDSSCSVTETVPGDSSWWETTYKVNGGTSHAGRDVSVTIDGDGTSVAFTNTRVTGDLVIEKTTEGGSGTFTFDVDCDDDAFDDTLTITDNGSAKLSGIPVGTDCTVTEVADGDFISTPSGGQTVEIDADGETVSFLNTRITGGLTISKTTNGGSGTFVFDVDCDGDKYDQVVEITDTGAETISGIPTGTSCTVTERENELFSSIVIPEGGSVVIDEDGETVAFTNSRITGPLTVTKTAVGGSGTFTFDVDCSDNAFDQVVVIEGSGSKTILEIPTTVSCTVTERANPLFDTSVSPADGTVVIDAGGENVAFTNTAKPNGISLDKKVNGGDHATAGSALLVHPLDELSYSVVITNTGQVPLSITELSDSLNANFAASCGQGVGSTLAVGASITCSYTESAGADANNVAGVKAVDGLGRPVSDEDATFVDVISPAISIVKTADPVSVTEGEVVTFTYVVTNSGDTALQNVLVTDDQLGAVGSIGVLAAGESATLTKTVVTTLATPLTNVGTAVGTDVLGRQVTASDGASITVVAGAVEVLPELPRTGVALGGIVLLGVMALGGGVAFQQGRHLRRTR